MIVALSTDEFNWNEKQKRCYFSYEKRKQLVESIRYVDLVIPEESWEQKISDIDLYKIDTFVMGNDWKGKFDFLRNNCEVFYIETLSELFGIKPRWIKQNDFSVLDDPVNCMMSEYSQFDISELVNE